jgi:hypothetical protein
MYSHLQGSFDLNPVIGPPQQTSKRLKTEIGKRKGKKSTNSNSHVQNVLFPVQATQSRNRFIFYYVTGSRAGLAGCPFWGNVV